jgi:hypothetical protein
MDALLTTIAKDKYPSKHEEFGGAGIIITDDPNRVGHEHDIVVYHPQGGTLAWFVFQLKNRFELYVDAGNKYHFYSTIAESLRLFLKSGLTAKESMLMTLAKMDEMMKDWNYAGKK